MSAAPLILANVSEDELAKAIHETESYAGFAGSCGWQFDSATDEGPLCTCRARARTMMANIDQARELS